MYPVCSICYEVRTDCDTLCILLCLVDALSLFALRDDVLGSLFLRLRPALNFTCLAGLLLRNMSSMIGDSHRISYATTPEANGQRREREREHRLKESVNRFLFSCCVSCCSRALGFSLPLTLRSSSRSSH